MITDREKLVHHLSVVNYYRLSAYWYPFKQKDDTDGEEHFTPGITFEMIWNLYTFDHYLRLLLMEAIEQVEIAILRTRMVEQFTLLHGPFGYCNLKSFNPTLSPFDHNRLLEELNTAVERSKEEFVSRFWHKYTSETYLPLWMAAEVMTFGQLFTFFRNLHHSEQQKLARAFDLYPPVLESWLHTLNFIRNACAHHARIWNRELPIRPRLPNAHHHPEWHTPIRFDNLRIFAVLTLLRYLLGFIDPQSEWQNKLHQLVIAYSGIPLKWMGFPFDWQECPVWKNK